MNPNFEKAAFRTVNAKDIINIRSQYNSERISENSYILSNSNYNVDENEFHTYLATVLIELDSLDD